jgi:flagellar hook-length control protein FliK
MNALPLSVSAAGLPAAQADDAAVLPPALLTLLATPPTTPVAALPTFDRTLQLLLDGAAAALPLAGAQAGDPAAMPETALGEDGADAEADAGMALHFDPALASLQPPPATLALAQASQAAWTAATAAPFVDAAPVAATTTPTPALAALAPAPVLAPQPAIPAAAAAATELLADTDPASAPKAAAGAPAQPAPARPAAVLATATVSAEPLAMPHERSPGVATLVLPQSGAADGADRTTAARSAETTPQGRAPSLLEALSERIAVQTERGAERVVIRLDPPLRGQIEIHIRQDATGATQVQLNASHADVVRQLHAIGDSLRQELAQRQGGDVNVQIAQQSREHDGRQQRQDRQGEPQQQPGRALDEQTAPADTARFALATDRP